MKKLIIALLLVSSLSFAKTDGDLSLEVSLDKRDTARLKEVIKLTKSGIDGIPGEEGQIYLECSNDRNYKPGLCIFEGIISDRYKIAFISKNKLRVLLTKKDSNAISHAFFDQRNRVFETRDSLFKLDCRKTKCTITYTEK